MSDIQHGGKWNCKRFCQQCGYNVNPENWNSWAGMCKNCVEEQLSKQVAENQKSIKSPSKE